MCAPRGYKFFHFYAVFGKKNRLAHPLWELASPRKILDQPLFCDAKFGWNIWKTCHLVDLLTLIVLPSDGFTHLDAPAIWWIYLPSLSCDLVDLLTSTDLPSDGFTHLDWPAIWWIYSPWLTCQLVDLLTLIVLPSCGFTHLDLSCHLGDSLTFIVLLSGGFNSLSLNCASGLTTFTENWDHSSWLYL